MHARLRGNSQSSAARNARRCRCTCNVQRDTEFRSIMDFALRSRRRRSPAAIPTISILLLIATARTCATPQSSEAINGPIAVRSPSFPSRYVSQRIVSALKSQSESCMRSLLIFARVAGAWTRQRNVDKSRGITRRGYSVLGSEGSRRVGTQLGGIIGSPRGAIAHESSDMLGAADGKYGSRAIGTTFLQHALSNAAPPLSMREEV